MSDRKDTKGRWTAMAAFTAIPTYWLVWLKIYWRGLDRLGRVKSRAGRWLLAHTVLAGAESLVRLSMIGFARWSPFNRSPATAPRNRSDPLPDYEMFETNFNGDTDQYLEAFSLIVPQSMRLTWRLGPFGGYTVPDIAKVSKFLRYVDEEKLPISAYYCAYPDASEKMIRAALELRPRLEKFNREFRRADASTFHCEYRTLLTDVQTIRNPRRDPARKTGTLSVVTRVVPERKGDLELDLALLADVLRAVVPTDRTHFASWVLTDGLEAPPGKAEDPTPYLLFSAWFDGPEEQYAKDLYRTLGGRAGTIWRHCGFVDSLEPEHFWRYMNEHRVEPGTCFHGYDGVTVNEVKEALEWAGRFSAFAVESQGLEAAALQESWRQTFPALPEVVEAEGVAT